MPKPVHFVIALVCTVIAVAIASLVLNVLVFVHLMNHAHSNHDNRDKDPVKLPLSQDYELPIVYEQDAPLPEVSTALVGTAPDSEISRALEPVELVPPGSVLLSLAREPLHVNDSKYCPSYGESLNTPAWKEAASILLNNIDQNVDPCDDFYKFACGSYISHTKIGKSRPREAQKNVNIAIRNALDKIKVTDETYSATERITKAAFESCMTYEHNHVEDILIDIANWFGAIPFLNQTLDDNYGVDEIIATAANLERMRALGTLMNSWVTVDYANTSQNVLYLSQPSLPLPRDFYVLPQFTEVLKNRARMIQGILIIFASLVLDDPLPYFDGILKAAEEVVQFERDIAMASWPDTEMRDYSLQYNAFTMDQLNSIYPESYFQTYVANLLSGVDPEAITIAERKIILSQPSYFGWLGGILNDLDGTMKYKMKTKIVNYMITQVLFEEAEFLGPKIRAIANEANYVSYVQRRGLGVRRIGRQLSRRFDSDVKNCPCRCIEYIMNLMPYGPGYVYAKSLPNREEIAKDAGEQVKLIVEGFLQMILKLDWMTTRSKMAVANKVRQIVINIGWPTELFGDFTNTTVIDDYHTKDYGPILEAYMQDSTDFFTIKHLLEEAFMNREAYRLLLHNADRTNFLVSPAMVNAWYQPERNSLTIPCALWIPPFYNKDYPKAFNFAAHGGIVGHELVHGFDDEGVQFDDKGELACNRSWNQCSWLDPKSKKGFTDMAQCVVTQYSTQCCPAKKGYVHCANGATTQGENIADLGGEQATYQAYLEYMRQQNTVEKRLPGLEQYTPNQVFWMSYANTWCANIPEDGIVWQLLGDVHSPFSCRTNQVVQDIPAFGANFGCSMGQKMFPTPDIRCKVWVES